jgi:hypothetical protein
MSAIPSRLALSIGNFSDIYKTFFSLKRVRVQVPEARLVIYWIGYTILS